MENSMKSNKECMDNKEHTVNMLLNDGSICWESSDRKELLNKTASEPDLKKLQHPEVRYEVTDHCNAECIMCPRDMHKNARPHGTMDLDKYKKSIDEVVRLGAKRIVLTGFGEPLIDKTLENKISYAKSKGLGTYIITNISLLTPKRSRSLICAGLDELRGSFLGMTPETYNEVMAKLDFQKSMNNMLEFLKIRKEIKSKIPKVQLSYIVLPQNEKDTDQFKKFWEERVEAIEIWKPHNWGDGRNYRERKSDICSKKSCGRPQNGPLQIQWNGEVIPCCYDYNNKIVLGNAFEQPIMEILNGAKYRLLRIAHREKKFQMFPFCDQCDQLLPHTDALVYTNRHNLPPEEAVKLSNTDLYNLQDAVSMDPKQLNPKYRSGL